MYDEARKDLDNAILSYDQAIWDYSASKRLHLTSLITESVSQVLNVVRQLQWHQDDELLLWMSSSYSLIEAWLFEYRNKRREGTLKWADSSPQFNAWRSSLAGSKESILWIHGPPGFGKSVLATYYIDAIRNRHRNSIVAYFFCRHGQAGLSNVRDVIRTLAFQLIVCCPDTLNNLRNRKDRLFDNEASFPIGGLTEILLKAAL